MLKKIISFLKEKIRKLNEMALAQQRLQLQQQISQQNALGLSLLRQTVADAFNQLPEYLRIPYKVYPNSLHISYEGNLFTAKLRISDSSKYTRLKCHEFVEELNNILSNQFYESLVDFDNELGSIHTYSSPYDSYISFFKDYSYRLIYCNIINVSAIDNTIIIRFNADFTKYYNYYPNAVA